MTEGRVHFIETQQTTDHEWTRLVESISPDVIADIVRYVLRAETSKPIYIRIGSRPVMLTNPF